MQKTPIYEAPGFSSTRAIYLCKPEQIEQTMRLLFYLNHWAKAHERLFFADRQGLYAIKGTLLCHAYTCGIIEATAYIDGRSGFGRDLTPEIAADISAEVVIERLYEVCEVAHSLAEIDDKYDRMAFALYTNMTGKESIDRVDVEMIATGSLRDYIYEYLQALQQQARKTSQAIPCSELMTLCIAPTDLLAIQDRRYYHLGNWDSWNELDESDLRKLDPEGLSLVAFSYTTPGTEYTFHLPLRKAETFLPTPLLAELRNAPASSREAGQYYGKTITTEESLQHPIENILRELGVDIAINCPHQLSDKQAHALAQALHYVHYNEDEEDYDEDEE